MGYPAFYDDVPRITLRDPLAEFLGAAEGGVIEYAYLDAVKLAGHSCPTVAGIYLMTLKALTFLYGEATPERGAIRVSFRGDIAARPTRAIAHARGPDSPPERGAARGRARLWQDRVRRILIEHRDDPGLVVLR